MTEFEGRDRRDTKADEIVRLIQKETDGDKLDLYERTARARKLEVRDTETKSKRAAEGWKSLGNDTQANPGRTGPA